MNGMRGILTALLLLIVFGTGELYAQVRPIYDDGASALTRQLERLQTTANVLHTGAHPDDEDSALVAYHARGENARTAYLSLTRGSGGQNIIGPELADLLGIIRTEELLQARRFDGAEQFFTRANDFGFSKRREEGGRLWGEDVMLEDMVATIRKFRPTVIVSRWNGTPSDGHGHHQFVGYLTPKAFAAAADPEQFPEQIEAGLPPWQAGKLYVSERGLNREGLLIINTGQYDPPTGRSYFEIGMHGRSQQKTQQMGSLELRGRQDSRLRLIESAVETPAKETSVFDGIDTTIRGIGRFESGTNRSLSRRLVRLEEILAALPTSYRPLEPHQLIPALVRALGTAREARQAANAFDTRRLLDEKIREIEAALVMAAGVRIDALSETETLIPGESVNVAVRVYSPDSASVDVPRVGLRTPAGWATDELSPASLGNEQDFRRRESASREIGYSVQVPNDARQTQPYWLELPRESFTYDWSAAGSARGEPFGAAVLTALVTLDIGGAVFSVEREVQYRERDRVRGELRRRLDIVPAISVEPATDTVIVPAASAQRSHDVRLTVRNNASAPTAGVARFEMPDGWSLEPASRDFSLAASPAATTLQFTATMPDDIDAGSYELRGVATVDERSYR